MDRAEQLRIIEALILASPEPVQSGRLAQIVPGCTSGEVPALIDDLNRDYQKQDRAFEIWDVAGGYQIRTRAEFSGYLQQLQKQRPLRLSRAALDTLSIVAYKQPATRAEIEDIRGVDAGAVLKGLLDRRLLRIGGHRDVPGRPMLYATTRRFLEVFGLSSLKGMPSLRELRELAQQKGVELPAAEDGTGEAPAEEAVPFDTPEEPASYPVAEASLELEFQEEGPAEPNEQGEEAWEPPEIVQPNS